MRFLDGNSTAIVDNSTDIIGNSTDTAMTSTNCAIDGNYELKQWILMGMSALHLLTYVGKSTVSKINKIR